MVKKIMFHEQVFAATQRRVQIPQSQSLDPKHRSNYEIDLSQNLTIFAPEMTPQTGRVGV
jgi:hypothetical protein